MTTVFTDLAAELAIPDDGTLSRTLYQDDQLRLVGFAFAEGQELTEHTSALAVVIQVVQRAAAPRPGRRGDRAKARRLGTPASSG